MRAPSSHFFPVDDAERDGGGVRRGSGGGGGEPDDGAVPAAQRPPLGHGPAIRHRLGAAGERDQV